MLKRWQVLNNRYQIHAVLGEGGFGAVYKGWDDNLRRHCAIKENLKINAELQKQFKREAVMLANLNHPHLVRVTDYFVIPNQGQYLVMDYVEGDNLETILTNNGGPLPSEQTLAWIRQVCDALIYIHNQNPPIIHRDIKPANIRITPQGNAMLVDFGLAKIFDDGIPTTTGARGLTPHFAAPEQYKVIGRGTDAQSDIYSLGVTLYCLLTNRVPPESVAVMSGDANPPPPVKDVNRNIPDSISDAIQRAMQIRRIERFKSVNDFKNALGASQAVQIVSPASKTPVQVGTSTNKLTLSNGMEFMRVPAGRFLMGSNHGGTNEKPPHTVDIPYDYWMARFPVTNELYSAYARSKGIDHPVDGWKKKKDHPVTQVKWTDAMGYCQWLNNLLKGELPSDFVLRLPTEAEWEKAARWKPSPAGRGQAKGEALEYPWGDEFDKNKCNTGDGGKNDTTSVGLYSPRGDSPYGCADMSGNVWDWTHTLRKDYPYKVNDGREDEKASGDRVLRGGSFYGPSVSARCAYRLRGYPGPGIKYYGFRVVVSAVLPS